MVKVKGTLKLRDVIDWYGFNHPMVKVKATHFNESCDVFDMFQPPYGES